MSRVALASLLAAMIATPDHFQQSPQIHASTRLVEIDYFGLLTSNRS